tara:strand:- start:4094 stop:4399 length:306 start_codon:yes stop_codon:yes gene_type:complete
MPRFELYLFIVDMEDGQVQTSEEEAICWVSDSNDVQEIRDASDKVVADKIESSERVIMFGVASVKVKGEEIMEIQFRNTDLEDGEVDRVIDLLSVAEEVAH